LLIFVQSTTVRNLIVTSCNAIECRCCLLGVECWNPAFDVTPASLITGGIITELGVYRPHQLKDALTSAVSSEMNWYR